MISVSVYISGIQFLQRLNSASGNAFHIVFSSLLQKEWSWGTVLWHWHRWCGMWYTIYFAYQRFYTACIFTTDISSTIESVRLYFPSSRLASTEEWVKYESLDQRQSNIHKYDIYCQEAQRTMCFLIIEENIRYKNLFFSKRLCPSTHQTIGFLCSTN